MNMVSKIEVPAEGATEAETRSTARWRKAAWLGLPVMALAALWGAINREGPAIAAMPTPTVTVAQPLVREVTEWDDYVGRFEASKSVEVRPRISGGITGVHFSDGAIVRKGQLLFTIDPRPSIAALAEARASVASAASDVVLANANLARAKRLIAEDAVSGSDLDQLGAQVRAANAALVAAQARVQARALDVEFTQVRAPISGRISDRRIDAGNLVSAGDTNGTLLTTINALDPIYFAFDASESLFLKSKRAGAEGSTVEVRLQDETAYRRSGRLDFTDNALDPRSGTVRGRAVLANSDLFLTPGMFGNMRLASSSKVAALLVPDAAIQTDQARKTVLTVARDGTVTPKPVALGPVVDGLRIVRMGLAPGDRVVISGTQMAMPGAKVQVRPGRIVGTPALAPPAATGTVGGATFAR